MFSITIGLIQPIIGIAALSEIFYRMYLDVNERLLLFLQAFVAVHFKVNLDPGRVNQIMMIT